MNKESLQKAAGTVLRASERVSPRLAARLAYRLFVTPYGSDRDLTGAAMSRRSRAVIDRAEALDVTVGKTTVRLYRWEPAGGAGKHARTVLMTHGWTLGARYLTTLVDPLLAAGFQVAALDFPGHGDSPGRVCTAPEAIRAIRGADDILGGVYALVGHSYGGSMSVLAAEGAPPMAGPMALDRLVLLAAGDRLADIVTRFSAHLKLSGSVRERIIRRIEKLARRPIDEIAASRILPGLGIPTLVVHDPQDSVVPFSDAEQIAAVPRVTLHRAERAGHVRILRSREVADTIAAFLRS